MNTQVRGKPLGWFDWRSEERQSESKRHDPEKRYHEPGPFRRLVRLIFPGSISRIRLCEAQERYLNLWRTLEYHKGTPCSDPLAQEEKKKTTEMCQQILLDAECLLTQRQNDLNFLWREMTRVHIMIVENILPDKLLPTQLDFCREDARRLAALKEPEVDDMLQRLAEVTQEDDISKNKEKMIRVIRALIERFTTIRTGRIHHQFVNIRIYKLSLIILIPILVILIANQDFITPVPEETKLAAGVSLTPPGWPGWNCDNQTIDWSCVVHVPTDLVKSLFLGSRYLLGTNIFAFIFFAGLAGGFFSVVIRLRNRELIPGEDAYFVWYVLSKPFIGAMGAVILFILLGGDYITIEILREAVAPLKKHELGASTFGFGFLAGFSERIVFPEFR